MLRALAAAAAACLLLGGVLAAADGVEVPVGGRAGAAVGRAPVLTVPASARAITGRTATVSISAADPDGEPVTVAVGGLPDGATWDAAAGTVAWTPSPAQAGTWPLRVEATDATGLATRATVELVARNPAHPHTYLALGDSVASGFGLQPLDYLAGDGCDRAEGEAYPSRVVDGWPLSLGVAPAVSMVACSGATVDDLFSDPVAGPEHLVGDGLDHRSQLDWAVAVNPAVVSVTIGANDLRFFAPSELLDGDVLDPAVLHDRLLALSGDLDHLLGRLVAATDATVVVTTYHDPAAASPQGVAGCEGACFAAAVRAVVDGLDATLATSAGHYPGRVLVADVGPAFAGHGAGNGVGPDGLRGGNGPSWLPSFVANAVSGLAGVSAYCASGHPSDDPWVSSFDCVHPNGSGAQAYADAVLSALAAAG